MEEKHYCYSTNSGHHLYRFVYFPVKHFPCRSERLKSIYKRSVIADSQMKLRLGSRSCPLPGGLLIWGKAGLWRCSLKCIRISITISMSHVTEGAESPPIHTSFWNWKKGKIREDETTLGKATWRDQKPLIVKIQEVKTFNKCPTKPQTNLVLLEH